MTVEAKLRITPQLEAVAAGLRSLMRDVAGLGAGVQQADAKGGFGKTQEGVGRSGAAARSASRDVRGLQEGLQAADAKGDFKGTQNGLQGVGARLRQAQALLREFLGTASADSGPAFRGTQSGLDSVSARIRAVQGQVLAFLGLAAGAEGVAALARVSDEYQALRARLRIVTNGQQEFNAALSSAKGLAREYSAPLNETVSLYTRLLAALRPLGGGTREAAVATEAMLAALKISGATAAESASAILQYSQAMGSGVLRGEEFNAINEAAPRLLDALAAGLGKSRSELKSLAEQGLLTTSANVKALAAQLPQLREEAALLPPTIGGAFQRMRDEVGQFVGAQVEASGAGRGLISVLNLIADNVSTLVPLVQYLGTALVALAFGRAVTGALAWVASIGAASSAARVLNAEFAVMRAALPGAAVATAGLSAATGVLAGAWSGLLALLGGPVGLVAILAALAGGYIALKVAQQGSADTSRVQARLDLANVRAEIAKLEQARSNAGGRAGDGRYLDELKAQLPLLERKAQLEAETETRGDFRKGERTAPVATADLRDPSAAAKFREEFKLPSDISRDAAAKRAKVQAEFDAELADARRAGNKQLEARLIRENAQRMRDSRRKEQDEIRDYYSKDAVTRLAQAKQLYNKDFELLNDATQREQKLNQEKFDRGLVDLQTYLAEKARLQDAEAAQDVTRLNAQLTEQRRVLALNVDRGKSAKDKNAQETADEAILATKQKIAELETDIEKRERTRLDNARALNNEAKDLTRELALQAAELDAQNRNALGTDTSADVERRTRLQAADARKRFIALGGDAALFDANTDIKVRQGQLALVQRELSQARTRLQQSEEAVRVAESAGAISSEEAERRVLAARREQLPVLQAIAQQLQALSASPEERAQAAAAELETARLGDLRTQLERDAQAAGRSGLGQFFTDVSTGAKTAGDALTAMLTNFKNQMLSLISQRLANRLFESFGVKSAVDTGVSFLTSLFGFHSGGIVSASGASFTRRLDVSPLAAALAPRYHSGGIVGMQPGERMAVLQDGEEVLTADDPRHVRNFRGGGGGVQVVSNVTINGAQGDKGQQAAAGGDLSRVIEAAVDQWALKQSRPGGLFSNR